MKIEEVEIMLNLLATNRINELKGYLLNERKKYYDEINNKKNEEYKKIIYAMFLKYMCDLKNKSYYGYINDKTIISNSSSLFILNDHLEIGKDESTQDFILSILRNVNNMLKNKGIIDKKYRELSYYVFQRGELAYIFKNDTVEYLNSFVGNDVNIYIDKKNPIAYAESEHGAGYILGLKK